MTLAIIGLVVLVGIIGLVLVVVARAGASPLARAQRSNQRIDSMAAQAMADMTAKAASWSRSSPGWASRDWPRR